MPRKPKPALALHLPALGLALLLSALQPFSPSALSQPASPATLTGRVYKPVTGEYVRDATIRVQGTGRVAVSEAGGEYILPGIPAGEVTVTVSFVGYETARATVTLAPGETLARDFDLYPLGSRAAGEIVKLDALVVTGVVEGQAKSLQNQKRSVLIGEHVASDAFGDVVEGNVGEFLKNLPGIDLEYVEFDARGPRMRGMDPQYVGVTLDGMKLASADAFNATVGTEQAGNAGSRAFGFESISLAAVDAVEVYKTLSADLDADAPAGIINMRTKRAFDRKGRRVSYSAGMSAVSEELRLSQTPGPGDTNRHKTRPSFSFEYSDVFLGGKLGVLFNYNQSSIFNEFLSVSNYTVNAPAPASGDPRSVVQSLFFTDGPKISDRKSASFRVDYKFSKTFSAGVNFMYSDYYAFFDNRQLRLYTYGSNGTGTTRANVTGDDPLLAFSTNGGAAYINTVGDSSSKFTKTYSLIPSFDWKPTKKLLIEGRFAWSQSDNKYKAFDDGHVRGTDLWLYGIDISARRSSYTSSDWKFVQTGGGDWGRLESFRTAVGNAILNPYFSDEARREFNRVLSGSLDATWKEAGWTLPTVFKAGLKARTDRRVFSDQRNWQRWYYYGRGGEISTFPNGLLTNNPYDLGSHNAAFSSSSVLPVAFPGRTWTYQFFQAHPEYFKHWSDPDSGIPAATLGNQYYTAFIENERKIDEDITAAYAKFDTHYKRLHFQAGVRFEGTTDTMSQWNPLTKDELRKVLMVKYDKYISMEDMTAYYNNSTQRAIAYGDLNDQYFTNPRQRVERTYDNLFFSTALKYDITDDLIFQLGMHQAIARPPLVQIAGPVSYNETETRVQSPNPGLLPEESNNYSARVAYYLPHSGVLSVGIFRIDIKNKWMSQYWVGENPNGDPPLAGEWNPADWGISDEYAGWTLQSTTNSRAEARFRGMEAEYRQTLGFLPGFLKSTFAYINYTRTYVEAREYFDTNGNRTRDMSVMGGVAPHQVNFGVDFKYKRLGFGLSGNWLDDTPWEFENSGARRMTRYREAAMKYHLNASFRLNQWATLALTGRNITNEPFVVNYRYYDGRPDVLYRSNIYGALWTLSLKGSF